METEVGSFTHVFHGVFMRVLERHVLVGHEAKHHERVPGSMVLAMTQERGPLRPRDYFIGDSLANELSKLGHLFTSFFEKPLHNFSPGGALYAMKRKPCGFAVAVWNADSSCSFVMPCRPANSSKISFFWVS